METLTPTATMQPDAEHPSWWLVSTTWASSLPNLDRYDGIGYLCSSKRNAERLCRAINAGAVFADPRIAFDIYGAAYVATTSRVMGKYMNADLKRLGY